MRVTIEFCYDVIESDGVGTANDAIAVALRKMVEAVNRVDSVDDVDNEFMVMIE